MLRDAPSGPARRAGSRPAPGRALPVALSALLLLSVLVAPVASAAAQDAPFDEGALRADLARFRVAVDAAVDRYAAAHGNWTSATTDTERRAARDAMASAGRDVGDAFLRFERGHGNASSLNAFIQERMPPNVYTALERNVVLLRALMVQADGGGDPVAPAEVRAQARLVTNALDRTEACIPEGCRGTLVGVAAQAFLILLREGFEAILVVGAVVAYLHKSNRGDKAPLVYVGVGAGVVASLVVWVVLDAVLGAAQPGSTAAALTEGLSMLLAAAVLFYVSFWLLSKAEARRWQAYIDGKVEDSLAAGRVWLLGLVGFLAVFREGVETALFLQALSTRAAGAGGDIALGLAAAGVVLAFVYAAVHVLGVKVPLRAFFLGTSALLYALAVRFVGLGVFELQEGALIPVTPIPALVGVLNAQPLASFLLQDLLGFVPTVEVLAAQGMMVAALVAGGAWTFARRAVARPAEG